MTTPTITIRRLLRWGVCLSAVSALGLHGTTLLIDHHAATTADAMNVSHMPDSASGDLSLSSSTHASPAFDAQAKNIKVMQWNVYMLPLPVGYAHDPACRSTNIGKVMTQSQASIITLNESFNRFHMGKMALSLKLKYPHQINGVPKFEGKRKINGGLSIFSKYPISKQHVQSFKTCQGSDCLSNKGFLHALVDIGRQQKLNVITTHLNSGLGHGNQQTRLAQVAEIQDYIKKNKDIEQWPTVLMGDLNVNGIRHETHKFPPNTQQLNDYGQLTKAMGNTCAECKTDRCRNSCNDYPKDAMRDEKGKWSYRPIPTRDLNSLNCVGPTLTTCLDFNDMKYWMARQRFDYIMALAPPKRAPKKHIKIHNTKFETLKPSPCEGKYLSDHKALSATVSFK